MRVAIIGAGRIGANVARQRSYQADLTTAHLQIRAGAVGVTEAHATHPPASAAILGR